MACHRAVVMAPGLGRTAWRVLSLPCGDKVAGGGWAHAEPARASTDCRGDHDPLWQPARSHALRAHHRALPLLPPLARLASCVQRSKGTHKPVPAANSPVFS